MSQYNIIFQGSIADGYRMEQVKRNLAALFKVDGKKVESLFTKDSVILKKGLTHDSAVKYRQALLKAGAVCDIKPSAGFSNSLPIDKAAPPSPAAQALKQSAPPPLPDQNLGENHAGSTVEKADTEILENNNNNNNSKALKDIIAGVVLIGIGFLFGGSVFLGNPGPLDYFFDGLGIFWIGKGIYRMFR